VTDIDIGFRIILKYAKFWEAELGVPLEFNKHATNITVP
jgi:hypothetical protein